MVYPPQPWNWPHKWFEEFVIRRATSKTYVEVDEFFRTKRRWITDKIFNRYLFWHTITKDSISIELLDWLCKDNTQSKWTLLLVYSMPDVLYDSFKGNKTLWNCKVNGSTSINDPRQIIYTFHFKDKEDLLLFKLKW